MAPSSLNLLLPLEEGFTKGPLRAITGTHRGLALPPARWVPPSVIVHGERDCARQVPFSTPQACGLALFPERSSLTPVVCEEPGCCRTPAGGFPLRGGVCSSGTSACSGRTLQRGVGETLREEWLAIEYFLT